MRITPSDLLTFAYCPYLYQSGDTGKLVSPLSLFEESLRVSILGAEQRALEKESYVTPRKISNIWENIWWPMATKADISPKDIDSRVLEAATKITGYCEYDISGPDYETVSVDIKSEIKLGEVILAAQIDLIKTPVFNNVGTVTLVDFSRKGLIGSQAANDIAVLGTIYAFSGLKRPIIYISVDLSEKKRKIDMHSSFFDIDDMFKLGNTLKHLANGLNNKVNYQYTWMCERCNLCHNSKS